MSTITITVRGQHEVDIAAEICSATVSAFADGSEREDVAQRTRDIAGRLSQELDSFADASAVGSWSTGRLQASSDRPWSQDGEVLPFVHSASVTFTADFVDFDAASEWLASLQGRDGVRVDNVVWELTADTRHRVEANVASEALRDAVRRADAYARTLGRSSTVPVAVADAGLLSTTAESAGMMKVAHMARMADSAGGALSVPLSPGRLRVSARVDAQFSAE